MPRYEFECPTQHRQEEQMAIKDRNKTNVICARCGLKMKRIPTLSAPTFPGAKNW